MSNNKIDVKKNGNVFTVYEGPDAKPMPLLSFDSEPPGFPRTFTSAGHLAQAYPGMAFNFVQRVVQPRPQAVPSQVQPAHEVRLPAVATLPTNVEQTAINYFQRMLDRYQWCSEEIRDVVKIQVEATAETLIELMPDIAEKLEVMRAKGARFELDKIEPLHTGDNDGQ